MQTAPGCLLGSTPPTLLMQSANTSQPSPGKEEEREGKEMAHLHQSNIYLIYFNLYINMN